MNNDFNTSRRNSNEAGTNSAFAFFWINARSVFSHCLRFAYVGLAYFFSLTFPAFAQITVVGQDPINPVFDVATIAFDYFDEDGIQQSFSDSAVNHIDYAKFLNFVSNLPDTHPAWDFIGASVGYVEDSDDFRNILVRAGFQLGCTLNGQYAGNSGPVPNPDSETYGDVYMVGCLGSTTSCGRYEPCSFHFNIQEDFKSSTSTERKVPKPT